MVCSPDLYVVVAAGVEVQEDAIVVLGHLYMQHERWIFTYCL